MSMKPGRLAFTLIELLVVITIIAILTGLVLGVAGPLNRKAGTSRAKAEIAAMDLALERYKTDNGDYPSRQLATPSATGYTSDPRTYTTSAPLLFQDLMGRSTYTSTISAGQTQYLEVRQSQVANPATSSSYFQDPFGYPYGYYYKYDGSVTGASSATDKSLFNSVQPDIWSTAGQTATAASSGGTATTSAVYLNWVKNWGSQ